MQQRHIVPNSDEIDIGANAICGKCYVTSTDDWCELVEDSQGDLYGQHPHLYHADPKEIPRASKSKSARPNPLVDTVCHECADDAVARAADLEKTPLRLMDIFCGAGGMSQGFARARVAEAKYAIDISPSCCETFK